MTSDSSLYKTGGCRSCPIINSLNFLHVAGSPSILNDFVEAMKTHHIPMKNDFSRPHTLCHSHFSLVKIKREDEIRSVIQAVENRRVNRIHLDRRSNPMLAIFSAPGGGKSRFLDILADHVQSMDTGTSSCLRCSVVLAISYNGATGTSSFVDKELGMSSGFGLAARILWSYFAGNNLLEFNDFCIILLDMIPHLSPTLAVKAVVEHRTAAAAAAAGSSCPTGTSTERPWRSGYGGGAVTAGGAVVDENMEGRVLLLMDELITSEEVVEGFSFQILSKIGELLDSFANFNAVVTSIKPGPMFQLNSTSGRPVIWISLRPFTLEESLSTLKETLYRHASFKEIMTLCVSDVGGHPRGLQTLRKALDRFFTDSSREVDAPNILEIELLDSVIREFAGFYNAHGKLTMGMVRMSLSGRSVDFKEVVGDFTVEDLMAQGVFLNSEVDLMRPRNFVPRLSIMRLRVFEMTELFFGDDKNLIACIKVTALRSVPEFHFTNLEVFHAHWEMLVRLVGWAGQMSLADFYRRDGLSVMPRTTEKVTIDFCAKTDGVIAASDERSIFGGLSAMPSCQAVYLAHSGQRGFDMVMFEKKVGGGHVAIFVDTKYSQRNAETYLKRTDLGQKWDSCLEWCRSSQAIRALKVVPEECFLVMASWRIGNPAKFRRDLLLDHDSRILLLDRNDLTSLYTPTLVSRPHWLTGNSLV